MTKKQWKDLTVNEKLDELRNQITNTTTALNEISHGLRSLTGGTVLREELAAIKGRLDILEGKGGGEVRVR